MAHSAAWILNLNGISDLPNPCRPKASPVHLVGLEFLQQGVPPTSSHTQSHTHTHTPRLLSEVLHLKISGRTKPVKVKIKANAARSLPPPYLRALLALNSSRRESPGRAASPSRRLLRRTPRSPGAAPLRQLRWRRVLSTRHRTPCWRDYNLVTPS